MSMNAIWNGRLEAKGFGNCWRGALLLVALGIACRATGAPFQLASTLGPAQAPPAGGGGDSLAPIVSADGRYVLFASGANNLVLAGSNTPLPALFPASLNVFLRDRSNATTTLVSVNLAASGGGNGDSMPVALSTNGRYALFESSASDLLAADTNNAKDIFIRDLVAGATRLVSVNTNGGVGNRSSRDPVMTPDGRYVAFASDASNLVAADTNGLADVFVRDLQADTTTLVSVGARATGPGAGGSESPDLTPDGRYVAFYSAATNLVAGLTNAGEVYVRDLMGGTTTWASSYARTAMQAAMGTANAVSFNHALSADGLFVAYQAGPTAASSSGSAGIVLRYNVLSSLTDVVNTNADVRLGSPQDSRRLATTPDGRFIAFVARSNSTATVNCVYVWDGQTGTTTLAGGDLGNNVPTNSFCDWPSLDSSGRYVVFLSSGTNLVTNAVAGEYHMYLRDLQAAITTLVDGDTNGVGSGVSPATAPQMSADGRFVAFECPDGSLVPDDRNHDYDVFVRDLLGGTSELVSVRNSTLPTRTPNGPSQLSPLSLSADGRYVAFASQADNLVPGDTNGCLDIFVRDLLLATNLLVTVGTNGVGADNISTDPAISADGRYVAFASSADNLVTGDTNKAQDVFVRDLQAGTTVLVSVNSSGTGPGSAAAYSPAISADGRYVMFFSKATNLAPGSFATGYENVFVRDLQAGITYALTHTPSGATTSPIGAMTPDGRFIAFSGSVSGSTAFLYVWDSLSAGRVYTNAISGIVNVAVSPGGDRIAYATSSTLSAVDRVTRTNWTIGALAATVHPGLRFSGDERFLVYVTTVSGTNQVYLYDLQNKTNLLVSHPDGSATGAYGASDWPEISSDGRFVAYRSMAANLVVGDTNGLPDVLLYDRLTNSTTLLSVNRFGTSAGDNRSLGPVFSGDGQSLVFQSWASDLVAQDFNHSSDLFAYRLYSSGEIPLFSATVVGGSSPGQGPWIIWPALPGKTYSVQFKNNLNDEGWQDLNGEVIFLGNQGCLNDTTAGSGPRFYRIVAY